MKTLAPGPRKREAIRAPSSPFIFRVFSLSPTVRLRSEPKCYHQSYRSATRSYYRFLLILILFVSLTRPRLRVPASFKIGRRQVAIVLASVVLPHLFCALAFPFGIVTRLGSPSPNSPYRKQGRKRGEGEERMREREREGGGYAACARHCDERGREWKWVVR